MALLTIAVMLALSPQSPAQSGRDARLWYQAYQEGVQAVGKNDAAAVTSLLAAKRDGPKPGRNVNTYGDNFLPSFNPDYYLGVAYLNLKQFAQADAAFKQVQQAGLIGPKDKENAAFTTRLAKASFELKMDEAQTALASKRFDQALEAALQASKIRGVPVVDIARAGELANKVKTAMATPSPTPATPTPTPNDPKYSPTPSPTTAPDPKPTANTTPTPYSTPTPTPTPYVPPKGPGAKGPRAPITPASSSNVSNAELEGMALFFKGEYGSAGDQLRTVTDGKSPTARAYFYLACAKVGLVLSRQADGDLDELLEQAKVLFKSAGGDSTMFSADRRYISPRILQMLGGTQ